VKFVTLIPYTPYIVGGIVTFTVLIVLLIHRRRSFPHTSPLPSLTRSSEWQLPDAAYSDRRNHVRREGPPVRILISSPALQSGVDKGFVLDRSTGGLRIATQVAMVPGGTLQVRAHNAPDTTPWVTVIVRSCKSIGSRFELGCEFDQTPPWNVLLLFG
jgi:hypothetical protein